MSEKETKEIKSNETRASRRGCCARVLALIGADVLTFSLVWLFVLVAYKLSGLGQYEFAYYEFGLLAMLVAFIVTNALFSLYQGNTFSPGTPLPRIWEMKRLAESSLIVHVAMLATMYYQKDIHWSRFATAVSCALICLLAQSMRNHVRGILHRFHLAQIPVLVIGANARSKQLRETLAHDAYSGYRVVADIPFAADPDLRGVRHVICCLPISQFRIFVARHFNELAHMILIPVQDLSLSSNMSVVEFQGLSGIAVFNQTRVRAYRFVKRLLEVVLTLIALVFAAPILLVLAILVKLTSRGPVFYVATRLGRDGKPIRIFKFRSMVKDAAERLPRLLDENPAYREEWERHFKLSKDPRVTPLGRFMRKTSLDELPQLLNVLLGDLALIGPRPIVEKEVELYGKAWPLVRRVKPGVTGLWQVSGRSDTSYEARVQLDLHYIYNWSPWMDVWIFLRTIISVIRMRGAV